MLLDSTGCKGGALRRLRCYAAFEPGFWRTLGSNQLERSTRVARCAVLIFAKMVGRVGLIQSLAEPKTSPLRGSASRCLRCYAAVEPLTVRKNPTRLNARREASASLQIWWVV